MQGVLITTTCMPCRCDCPNHKSVNATWPGYPPLPVGSFVDAYGVRMVGQFLVERPEDGKLVRITHRFDLIMTDNLGTGLT